MTTARPKPKVGSKNRYGFDAVKFKPIAGCSTAPVAEHDRTTSIRRPAPLLAASGLFARALPLPGGFNEPGKESSRLCRRAWSLSARRGGSVDRNEKSGPRLVLVEKPNAVQGCSCALTTGVEGRAVAALVGRPNYRVNRCPDFASRAVHSGSSSSDKKWFSPLASFSEDKA
jgi:hypothetical protein